MNLRIPGPTPCPPEVLQSMTKQMINHRGKEFGEINVRVTERMKGFFQTKNDLLILTGSGTGGMETAVVNMLSPGDKVLAVSIGVFGNRFAQVAEAYGAKAIKLDFEWGRAADPDRIRQALTGDPEIKAVIVTHNETSTGVTNPLEAISGVVKGMGKLLIVDAISSIGSIDLPVDRWNCDVVVGGSQKGWMIPPGLTFVSVSEQAWAAYKTAKMPRFYWDLGKAKSYLEKGGQNPWTPAVSLYYALDAALAMMETEGLGNIVARHVRLGQKVRDGVKSLGLSLFADEKSASNTVTAVKATNGLDMKRLTTVMREETGVVVSGGQQSLEGKICRIGHMGYVTDADVKEVVEAMRKSLPKAGFVPVKA